MRHKLPDHIFNSHGFLAETVFTLCSKFGWSNLQVEHAERILRDIVAIITPRERLKVIKKIRQITVF